MYKTLSAYIARLEEAGELIRIGVPVDPVLEITEITDRESKRPGGGKALLFENTGTPFPVLTNMMGSDRRIALALGVEQLDELPERIDRLFATLTSPRPDLESKLRMLPRLMEISRWLPRYKKGRGECQQVVHTGDEADIGRLPVLKCWPHDGGRFVTLPLVNTLDPETGIRNVGMYRMQLFSKNTTGMHWHMHKTGERHYRSYQKLGKRMPVSVCLGGDPAYTYAATAPMPDNIDEYLLAGFLRRHPVKLVRCLTNEIMVPADCDFVIEGYVDPAEAKTTEGPFGDHTGFYSLEDEYPVFHITAVTHRRNAVYPATIVGVPPQEDAYIAKATEKIFLAPIRKTMLPEMRDLYMPQEGTAHNIAVVNIEKSYPGQGLKVASSLWGAGQMMFNKFLVVAATGKSIRDPKTLQALFRGLDIERDILISRGPLDVLDHAAPRMGFGGKMAFDLTNIGAIPGTLEDADDPTPWNTLYSEGVTLENIPGTLPGQPREAFPLWETPPLRKASPETAPGLALPGTFRYGHGVTVADTSLAESWNALIVKVEKTALHGHSAINTSFPTDTFTSAGSDFSAISSAGLSIQSGDDPIRQASASPAPSAGAVSPNSPSTASPAPSGGNPPNSPPAAAIPNPFDIPAFLRENGLAGIKFVVIVDQAVDTSHAGDVLWLAAGNCDPARDVTISGGIITFDARAKAGGINGFDRRWPNVVASSPATIALVDGRWSAYGLGAFIPSPSLRYLPLQPNDGAAIEPEI